LRSSSSFSHSLFTIRDHHSFFFFFSSSSADEHLKFMQLYLVKHISCWVCWLAQLTPPLWVELIMGLGERSAGRSYVPLPRGGGCRQEQQLAHMCLFHDEDLFLRFLRPRAADTSQRDWEASHDEMAIARTQNKQNTMKQGVDRVSNDSYLGAGNSALTQAVERRQLTTKPCSVPRHFARNSPTCRIAHFYVFQSTQFHALWPH
jgi:hypothetical protein